MARKYPDEVSASETKTAELKSNYPPSGTVTLIFKHNRSFELHLDGRIFHRFEPNGKLDVPREVLSHKDFTPDVKAYFNIKE